MSFIRVFISFFQFRKEIYLLKLCKTLADGRCTVGSNMVIVRQTKTVWYDWDKGGFQGETVRLKPILPLPLFLSWPQAFPNPFHRAAHAEDTPSFSGFHPPYLSPLHVFSGEGTVPGGENLRKILTMVKKCWSSLERILWNGFITNIGIQVAKMINLEFC